MGDDEGTGRVRLSLAPSSALLMVSETCAGCDAAVEAFSAIASDARWRSVSEFVVISPNGLDGRVQPPLRLERDDELYRSLYAGTTPALYWVDGAERVHLLGAIEHSDQIEPLLQSALKQKLTKD